jgi:hypothetical protein
MTTQFEFFEGTRTESQTPQVTVRRSGQLVLTPPAAAMLGEDVTHVQVGYNAQSGIVGIRAAVNGAKGRYRLRARANGSSLVDGRRFLGHHGLRVENARTFPAEVVGEGIVGFRLGEGGSETGDAEETPTPAKVDAPMTAPTATRKPVRTVKRKAAAATA